jgi:hypothetical protein
LELDDDAGKGKDDGFSKDYWFSEESCGMTTEDVSELNLLTQTTEILVNNFCSLINFQKSSSSMESFYQSNKLHKKMVNNIVFAESLLSMEDQETNQGAMDFQNSEPYIQKFMQDRSAFSIKQRNLKELSSKLCELLQKSFFLCETIFMHIYSLKERAKHKQRDHYFYLNSLRILTKYSELFFNGKLERFKQEGSYLPCEHNGSQYLSISTVYNFHTMSEQFQARFELPMKFENDLKMNLVLNMPTLWINLQLRLIKLIPD